MNRLFKKTLAFGFGMASLTEEKVNRIAKEAMKSQGISEREARQLAKDLLKRSQETQRKINAAVGDALSRTFKAAGLATQKDIEALKRHLRKRKL